MRKSKTCEYFLASRLFEMAELKILIDSVQSSHFITKRKSELLIKKLKGLVSKPQARDFSGQICIYDRIKSMNESVFYNVDTLHNAIASNRKITFRYFDYNIKRKKVFRKNGGYYCINPVALTFDNENYYLIAFNEKYEDFVHYKVDRMTDIAVGEERRIMPKNPFNAANYVKPLFSMFDGKTEDITAVFDSAYLNVVIDRFGENVRLTKLEADCFRADFQAAVSPTFLAWFISFGTNAYMTKDFSAKLYTPLKTAIIVGYYLQSGDADAEAFIKKGITRIMKFLIDEVNVGPILKLLETGKFVTAKNVTTFIDYANPLQKMEIQLRFMNYSHEHFPPKKPKLKL